MMTFTLCRVVSSEVKRRSWILRLGMEHLHHRFCVRTSSRLHYIIAISVAPRVALFYNSGTTILEAILEAIFDDRTTIINLHDGTSIGAGIQLRRRKAA